MKFRVKTSVATVLLIVSLFALPFLVLVYQPTVWFVISSRVSRNEPLDASPQDTASADPSSTLDPSDGDSSLEVEQSTTSADPSSTLDPSILDPRGGNPSFEAEQSADPSDGDSGVEVEPGLESMLRRAATSDKTVIVTTLNQAWATRGTMIDVFLDSFRGGEATEPLLAHLVVVALDQRSFQRCRELHQHCFRLRTPGVDFSGSKAFMSRDFLKMMWRRMRLLRHILELGYNFVFTDADILWLRNPFDHFANDADFQISCDKNRGTWWSISNQPNCGFQFARSNERTIAMYRHWCRGGAKTPEIDEQTLLKKMLHIRAFAAYKVKIRFLPTERFSGFCQRSNNMSRVVTMHANCCTGLKNKLLDLRTALGAWEVGKTLPPNTNTSETEFWHVPDACLNSLWPSPPPPAIWIDSTSKS